MTGAFLFANRDGERKPVEVEFLTDEEIDEKFLSRPSEDLVGWLKMLCKTIRQVAPLLEELEREGILKKST